MPYEGKLNPDLRYEFEELPIEIKNSILEAGIGIETADELREAAERIMYGALY